MKKIEVLFSEYSESHLNPINKFIHWICVPLIFFSLVGLFWAIPFPNYMPRNLNWAKVALIFAMIYYIRLSLSLSVGLFGFAVLCLYGNYYLSGFSNYPLWQISLWIFVFAWIGQFLGHKIEGKKPSFFKDLQFLLIGPAWLMGHLYKKMGVSY